MTRSRLLLPWLLLMGIFDPGCAGTETGNPPRASLSLSLESSDAQHFSIGSAGAGVKITEAQIGIRQLALTECNAQAVTEVAQGVTVNLRGGESAFEVPEQQLCVVELSFGPRDIGWASVDPGANPQLSLGVAGLTTVAAPLFIEDDATPLVVFRPSTFQVTADSQLILSLDVAKALNFGEIAQLSPNNAGDAVITSQLNGPILTNIHQRWAASWNLYAVSGGGGKQLIATGEAQ